MKLPSLKSLTREDIDDIADLIEDAACMVDLKDVKETDSDALHTLAAKQYASKLLHALAIEIQNKRP